MCYLSKIDIYIAREASSQLCFACSAHVHKSRSQTLKLETKVVWSITTSIYANVIKDISDGNTFFTLHKEIPAQQKKRFKGNHTNRPRNKPQTKEEKKIKQTHV